MFMTFYSFFWHFMMFSINFESDLILLHSRVPQCDILSTFSILKIPLQETLYPAST